MPSFGQSIPNLTVPTSNENKDFFYIFLPNKTLYDRSHVVKQQENHIPIYTYHTFILLNVAIADLWTQMDKCSVFQPSSHQWCLLRDGFRNEGKFHKAPASFDQC